MKYYGTKNNKDYGFYLENFDNAIEISDEYWEELLQKQGEGKTIIPFENEVIAVNIEEYIFQDGIWKKLSDKEVAEKLLQKAKDNKIYDNDTARDEALLQGVIYQDILFDSDTDQKINLLATIGMMNDTDIVTWFGMDNIPLECTKVDLINIGGLITQLHTFCWTKNAQIKMLIKNASTIEEVEAINIDYGKEE